MHSIIAFRQRAKTLETTTDLIIEISQQKTIFEKQQEDIFATLNYVKTVDLAALNRLFDRSKTIYCYPTGFSQKKALEEFSKMMLSMEKHHRSILHSETLFQ